MNEKKDTQNVLDLKPNQRSGGRLPHPKIAQFTPDEDLIQSTSRIKSQRDIILERIRRMQTSEGRVSNSVFEKVKRDYALQLDTINELLDEKKQVLKDEIRKLYMIREKLTVEVNRHREILEEADFRHYLGEFTQSQYQEVENFETKEIEKAEGDLAHVSQWIRTHEELFDPQDFGQKPQPPQPSQYTPKTPPRAQETTQTAYRQPAPERAAPQAQEPFSPQHQYQQPLAPSVPVQAQPVPAQPVQQAPIVAEPVAATHIPQPTVAATNEFAHLFSDTDSQGDSNLKHNNFEELDHMQNLDELIQEVQASTEEIDFLADNAPDIQVVATAKPTANLEDANYFADENMNESSFKVPTSAVTLTPEKNGGESVTIARTAVTPQPQQTPSVPVEKDDSISDILESIRLEGEDDVISTNSDLPLQPVLTDFKLKLVEGDLDIKEYPMKANTSIGRSPSNDVVLKEPKVSRQHAAINLYNDSYILVDLKSSNGVFVNGTKVDETVLHAGDEVSIGGYKFIFMKND